MVVSPVRALAAIWAVLTPALRRRFFVLQFLSVLMAMSTVMGLASVMTFLAVLADPTLVETHAALNWLWQSLEKPATRDFLVTLGGVFIAVLLLSAVVNVVGTFVMGRFAHAVGDRIREVLFAEYLRRDYLFHARVGAGRLMDNVLNQTDRVTVTLLNGQLLITNAMLTLLVVVSIAIVNTTVAVVSVLAVAGSYFLFYRVIRRRIARNGRVHSQLGGERVAVVEQAFLSIKYLLIARAQPLFRRRLTAATRALSHAFADTQFIAQSPKYVLECVAGSALIACAAFASGGIVGGAWLAQLSFIGFAGFRLLPAVQQIYHGLVSIRANRHAIESLAAELDASTFVPRVIEATQCSGKPAPLRSIELVGVRFRYSPDGPLVLDNATLRIAAGAAIGIVGASGCGKTTLVDLLLGLLNPVGGRIEIDGEALDPRRVPAWQQSIGYVPQEVMILDASVRENIAFGIDPGEIDDDRVRDVASQAGASEFIATLPGGYNARLSGVGASLSGGQRQRIGIARALYGKPSLLVLDEATNALDADTERAIIDTVVRNRGAMTILIVAHGAVVIDACDRVYEMRDGTLHERNSPAASGRATRLRWGSE
jgi:HlyD family secretion protein